MAGGYRVRLFDVYWIVTFVDGSVTPGFEGGFRTERDAQRYAADVEAFFVRIWRDEIRFNLLSGSGGGRLCNGM